MQAKTVSNENKHASLSNSNSLSQLYRLYSPSNKIKPYHKYLKNHLPHQPPVIQLICTHPHLLFIPSHDNNNPNQNHSTTQFNILQNILQRKNQFSKINKKSTQTLINKKPMTAPNAKRQRRHLSTQPQQQKQAQLSKTANNFHNQNNQINLYNIYDFKQNPPTSTKTNQNNTNFSPYIPTNSLKPHTSHSRSKRQSKEHNNLQITQLSSKFSYRNSFNRTTFEGSLDQKRKTIRLKYQEDKIARENKYRSNNPKAQLYVNAQFKFAKFVKKYH